MTNYYHLIPAQYQWLLAEGAPRMLVEALKLYGTKEIYGTKHNPEILSWAKELGIEKIYTADETPWCSLAHAVIAKRAGKVVPLKGYDLLRALRWVIFGDSIKEPMLGDTLIFKRDGGGHVGIYVGEDKDAYHVLGGNQSDMYCIVRIAKNRLYEARRPHYNNQPANVRKVFLSQYGQLSKNER